MRRRLFIQRTWALVFSGSYGCSYVSTSSTAEGGRGGEGGREGGGETISKKQGVER